MSETEAKPLKWSSDPEVGYTVERRPDGGLKVVFSDLSKSTLDHWRRFALEHLIDSDRLTRNLYDLRQIDSLPEVAVNYAVEVNYDPSVRNIRLAVVVASADILTSVR